MASLRGVLDTNVFLSGIAYPPSVPGKILSAWRHGSMDVLLSTYFLAALCRVLPRLAHRHGMSAAEIDDLVDALSIHAEIVEPLQNTEANLRDPDDQPVLAILLAALKMAEASYLITGDKDFAVKADRPQREPAREWRQDIGNHGSVMNPLDALRHQRSSGVAKPPERQADSSPLA